MIISIVIASVRIRFGFIFLSSLVQENCSKAIKDGGVGQSPGLFRFILSLLRCGFHFHTLRWQLKFQISHLYLRQKGGEQDNRYRRKEAMWYLLFLKNAHESCHMVLLTLASNWSIATLCCQDCWNCSLYSELPCVYLKPRVSYGWRREQILGDNQYFLPHRLI